MCLLFVVAANIWLKPAIRIDRQSEAPIRWNERPLTGATESTA